MTTVCAIARDGRVLMGADSMTNVYDRPVYGLSKIVAVTVKDSSADPGNGVLLIGVSGSAALIPLLKAHLGVASTPAPDERPQTWAGAIASAITQIAVEHGITSNGQMDGAMLLGWRGQLWTVFHHQAISHQDGFAAIGSGEGPAMGCLDYGMRMRRPLLEVVTTAVAIGIRHDRFSGGEPEVQTIG